MSARQTNALLLQKQLLQDSSTFDIIFADHCVGLGSTTSSHDESGHQELNWSGQLKVSSRGQVIPVDFKGSLHLNSLLQVVGSIFDFSIGNQSFRLGSLGVNPIEFSVSRVNQTDNLELAKVSVPGPVTLTEYDPQHLRVQFPFQSIMANNPLSAQASHFAAQILFNFSNQPPRCNSEKLEEVDLTLLTNIFSQQPNFGLLEKLEALK